MANSGQARAPRAVWFAGPRRLELRDEPLAELGTDEVRVQAIASGISHGTEMLVYRGQVPAELELDLPTLRGAFSFPIKYGYASVGRVVEAGQAVTTLAPGDLVFALHPHQTAYVLPASLAVRLPPDLDPERGVFLANAETAVNVLLDAAPRLGERCVVFGQGVVGLLVVQLLRQAGVGLVIAVDPIERRRQLARQVGADLALAPDDAVVRTVRELTDGLGADIVFEASGSGPALGLALDCVAFEGTIVVSSWYGTKPVQLPLGGAFHRKRLRIVSSQVGTIAPSLQPRWSHARRMALARAELERLTLTPLITQRVAFEDAASAYRLIDTEPEQTVQVVLRYDTERSEA